MQGVVGEILTTQFALTTISDNFHTFYNQSLFPSFFLSFIHTCLNQEVNSRETVQPHISRLLDVFIKCAPKMKRRMRCPLPSQTELTKLILSLFSLLSSFERDRPRESSLQSPDDRADRNLGDNLGSSSIDRSLNRRRRVRSIVAGNLTITLWDKTRSF